ncbi:motility associated factor glycosyltransferase family protein [Lysinibacillus fusiformis]|uniref:motility associated factor glycosyltransferase family protein n=1 Tax=Lysinibacillus fusiformis TaxID=28031 RepID=UPI0018E63224|nr:6-hydroxymethylpterin diphosphokinase MptE-like protein [Lysinibacillus fusiformis]MBI6865216.1 motility associated factor glycosyltransferase family protein [Lysinibacillus fusiformis]
MKWYIQEARNGELTLLLNGVAIYSKYRPYDDAMRWVVKEFNQEVTHYLVIGLGLGYHAKALAELTNKPIYVYYFEQEELALFQQNGCQLASNIKLVNSLEEVANTIDLQLLLSNAWLKAIGKNNTLYDVLDTIKRNQISYKKFAPLMYRNAEKNKELYEHKTYPKRTNNTACLVASGPSLNDTVQWLVEAENVDIYVVGSALKLVLAKGIQPKAVVITDAQPNIVGQLDGTDYRGLLFYLLTANAEAVALHQGKKYMLCQQGYDVAEEQAEKYSLPKLATGGSVATTTFSLLECLGYQNIVLFGQDLGFTGEYTHAAGSTSGKGVGDSLIQVQANDRSNIKTQPNLQVYLRWFNEHCPKANANVYNTARQGAKINGTQFITKEQFLQL